MKKSILFSVLVVGTTLLQAQSITIHQTCGQNGQVLEVLPVDLGLSVKWANMNVGTINPEGYGDYFTWEEATTNVNWGGSWRMPTVEELQELRDNCTWTWTTQNGVNGCKVTSNKAGYADKFIFLPAAGIRTITGYLGGVGSSCGYWSSSYYGSGNAWGLDFSSDILPYIAFFFDYEGRTVRLVRPSSITYSPSANDTIRIYSNGCDDYQTFIGSHGSQLTMTAQSGQWSHFVRWNDGNTDNPRTITTNGNADYMAYFETPNFSVQVKSSDAARGSAYIYKVVKGNTIEYNDSVGSFEAGSEVFLAYQANYGYHFDKWSDGNRSQQRSFILTKDTTFTATFAKNVYSITKDAEHGTISGNSSAEYLDFVTLTVTPNYGYHFTQWSDGLKDNPRIFQITKDTAFTAEFAYDRVGTCGKDLALVWSYDPTNKVLTIGNAGSFAENMQYGVEALNEMEELVIGNSVTAIGANAFAGISSLKKVSIGESVKTIGEQAFYNCVNLETIFNYRPTPTNTYSNAFDGVDKFECELYVLPNSIDMYKAAAVWRDFYYTYAIGAEETTIATNDVQVEPQDNAATLTWPTNDNAASYTIQITKDGIVFCTLIFNSNGQLTGIAFAPSRDGQAHAPQAIMTANGLQFTVTGLDSGTQYGYNLTAKDSNDQTVATYSGEFTTTSEGEATGVEGIQPSEVSYQKILRNGQIFILRGEKIYTLQGQKVK